ncbi:YceH family protein [Xanthomonadaceae bacterium JHOS43]|nr:YceH family protein [Xanthomonadaceae bacterium JHOS43]MCX7562574.1 YceH family protein [Xanthomonadaceae bacterium XH05]
MTDTDATADADLETDALRLTAIEARVLGCLIEKEATTPDQYPLTENALTVACNQKTSRDPVMELSPGEVGHALRRLEPRHLVRSQHAARAQRWAHRFAQAFGVTVQQQAALCVLMLRGPQTLSEILTRSERIGRFADVDEVRHALERLAQREPALALQLPRASGQREDRWTHLLCGPVDVEKLQAAVRLTAASTQTPASIAALEARIDALEARIAALEAERASAAPHLP